MPHLGFKIPKRFDLLICNNIECPSARSLVNKLKTHQNSLYSGLISSNSGSNKHMMLMLVGNKYIYWTDLVRSSTVTYYLTSCMRFVQLAWPQLTVKYDRLICTLRVGTHAGSSQQHHTRCLCLHPCVFTSESVSQGSPGLCTLGSSPCARASTNTAGRWSRVSWRSSAASTKRSTRWSSSRTACRSCSKSSEPARYESVRVTGSKNRIDSILRNGTVSPLYFKMSKYTCSIFWGHPFSCDSHYVASSLYSLTLMEPWRPTQYQLPWMIMIYDKQPPPLLLLIRSGSCLVT